MSHFTCLVIGDDIDKQLAPFNEQPDEDDEACKPFLEWRVYGKNGTYTAKTKEEVEKACIDAGDTIDDRPYYENPQAKWDWYVVGGRWTGFFKLKPINLLDTKEVYDAFLGFSANELKNFVKMAKENISRFEKVASKYNAPTSGLLKVKVKELIEQETKVIYPEHSVGRPGLMTPPAKAGKADQVRKKDIDFEGMFADAAAQAGEIYDLAMKIFGEAPVNESWEAMRERLTALGKPIQDIREEYHAQPRCEALKLHAKENKDSPFGMFGYSADNFLCTREEFIKRAQINTVSTYAILKDGEWIEKGKMGWFGVSNDKMTQDEWNDKFMKFLEELPDDTLLTVVDCRI